MNVLDLRAAAGYSLPGSLAAAPPAVARLACLVAADILGLDTRMLRAEVVFEQGSVQLHIFPRLPELIARGDAAGRIGAEIARLTGCPAVAVNLRAESRGWFE